MGPVHALTTHKHSSFRPHCLAATHDTRLRLIVIVIVIVICVVIVVLYESGRWREELEDAELEEREAEELGVAGDWRGWMQVRMSASRTVTLSLDAAQPLPCDGRTQSCFECVTC